MCQATQATLTGAGRRRGSGRRPKAAARANPPQARYWRAAVHVVAPVSHDAPLSVRWTCNVPAAVLAALSNFPSRTAENPSFAFSPVILNLRSDPIGAVPAKVNLMSPAAPLPHEM